MTFRWNVIDDYNVQEKAKSNNILHPNYASSIYTVSSTLAYILLTVPGGLFDPDLLQPKQRRCGPLAIPQEAGSSSSITISFCVFASHHQRVAHVLAACHSLVRVCPSHQDVKSAECTQTRPRR